VESLNSVLGDGKIPIRVMLYGIKIIALDYDWKISLTAGL